MAYSPARRSDDRYARDRREGRRDDRTYRNRSPSRERRHDDRDRDSYRRRDYNRYDDRRDDRRRDRRDDRRDDRDGRLNDPKRSRDASPVRDRERRDGRDRYEDSRDTYDNRDRKRPRRTVSPRPEGKDRRGSTHEVSNSRTVKPYQDTLTLQNSRPSTGYSDAAELAKMEEEKKQQEARRARIEAWKAERIQGPVNTSSPAADSPKAAPTPPITSENGDSPFPKPKVKPDRIEIQKRLRARKAADAEAKNKPLGADVAIPTPVNDSSVSVGSATNGTRSTKVDAKLGGLGLSKTVAEKTEQAAPSAVKELNEEEKTGLKLRKLQPIPSSDMDNIPDAANDDDEVSNELRDDEEVGEADREVAQRRAQEAAQAEADKISAKAEVDVEMKNADAAMPDAEDEVDPLDAFMDSLETPAASDPYRHLGQERQEPQMFHSDDEGDDEPAVDQNDDFAAIMKKSKKKEIAKVDHAKMNYLPFRKNFYSESVEIAEMTKEEVDEARAELDNITVKGENPPKPIQKFPQGGFGTQILQIIRELKFDKPSSIQSQALPAIMSGRDTIGVAKTGSGKTMAFCLPMFRHIKDQPPLDSMDGPIGLIMAPTRELAVQIHRDCKPFLKALNLRAVCAYGGAPIKDQIAELKRGAEIVVCTPGRIIDLLSANNGRVTNLRRVSYVVLDEADRMFDMGFEPQITKIMLNIRPDRQTILFSATFPPKMETLARKALNKPVEILVGGKSVVPPEITQVVEVIEPQDRFKQLLKLLGDLLGDEQDVRCLVFVERQETADALFKELGKKGYASVSIHGGREQIDRDEAIQNFKAGIYPVMIATSVAARGLDVKQLKLVINYDCPNHTEDYVHRCGRTGRAGNTGTAVTFVLPDQDRYAAFLTKALKESKQEPPAQLKEMAEKFQKKLDSGEAKKYGGGFGGKGIERLDQARRADEARLRKQYRAEDAPEEDETTDGKKKTETDKTETSNTGRGGEESDAALPATLAALLKAAMNVQKSETPPPAAAASFGARGGAPKRPGAPLTKAEKVEQARAAADRISNRVGTGNKGNAQQGQHKDNHGPDAGAFHATLEINDFPQKARWSVTNRTNTSKILDASQVSITTKGVFYAAGTSPKEGELPKLYILVEGPTKIIVEDSMAELVRLLKEGTVAALEGEERGAKPGGRYSVV